MSGRRKEFFVMIGFVAWVAYAVWFPWIQDIRTGRAERLQLQWSGEQRERSLHAGLERAVLERQHLEKQWARLSTGMVPAGSATAAGTELLRGLQQLAQSSGVVLRSSGLTPPDGSQDPVRLTADLRGEGERAGVVDFLYRLGEGPPAYRIPRVRIDGRPGDSRVTFEMVVMALWSPGLPDFPETMEEFSWSGSPFSLEATRNLSVFGMAPSGTMPQEVLGAGTRTYETNWRVVGMVQGRGEAIAIMRHRDGTQRVVQVGDSLGDEQVEIIDATRVVLSRNGARAVVFMDTEPIGSLNEGEVIP